MAKVIYDKDFQKSIEKRKDNAFREQIKKQIQKIIENPEIGKPLRYNLKGEKTVYVWPFRIIYSFFNNTLYFLRFEHRKDVYD